MVRAQIATTQIATCAATGRDRSGPSGITLGVVSFAIRHAIPTFAGPIRGFR
jgi:hypothetical protein